MKLELIIVILFTASAVFSCFACTGIRLLLVRSNKMDIPNERSNHQTPVPRGGGIAVMLVILATILAAYFQHGEMVGEFKYIFFGAGLLALISWIDDIKGLPVLARLIPQFAIVTFLTFNEFKEIEVFHGLLPVWADQVAVIFIWVWFLNLYNFMDGIDGISAIEAITIFIGIFIATSLFKTPPQIAFFAAVVGGAMLGFLFLNWHPAKLFLGDVGSIPVGFLLGWLLLELSASGYTEYAAIISGYYLADSGITLIRRLLKKKMFWQSHSEHFYQLAVRGGFTHKEVVTRIIITNLILLAIAALLPNNTGIIISGFVIIFVLRVFWNSCNA
jgi:UDP-N-acetylmuramyl pentapeptide phosphotransferase/UDP-N-acetylglucosamine-1-phosphate transferase